MILKERNDLPYVKWKRWKERKNTDSDTLDLEVLGERERESSVRLGLGLLNTHAQ